MTQSFRIPNVRSVSLSVLLCIAMVAPLPLAAHEIADQESQVRPEDEVREHRMVVETAYPRLWRLREGGYLGVHLIELTPELRAHFGVDASAGVMVGTVAEESPAATAGLLVGDIITAIDGESIGDRGQLARMVGEHQAGDSMSIEIFRDGVFEILEATVEARKRPQLWLNSLDGGGDFSMQWSTDDDGLLVIPSPGGRRLEVHGRQLDEAMETLHERLASPDFSARMLEFTSNTEELEARIKELETRLLELSKQLEALEED